MLTFCAFVYFLGSAHGNVDINSVFRGAKATSRCISSVSDELRAQVKEMLLTPFKEGCLTICLDYWTDPYKKISYTAVTATFVTDECSYQSIDLFCRPFHYKKKSADLTLNVSLLIFCYEIIVQKMSFYWFFLIF